MTSTMLDRCSGQHSGAGIPAEARVGYCTQLIEGEN
jgi:hypothetical protein